MHILNEFFDKIYVITIPRNKERLDLFLSQKKGIEIELFNGVDGKTLYPEIPFTRDFPISFFEENGISADRGRSFNKGQLGCALSNLLLQKEIVRLKLKNALILEDDAVLVPGQLDYFENAINQLPTNWELFYLGYNNMSKWTNNFFTRMILLAKYNIWPIAVEGKKSNVRGKNFFSKPYSKLLYVPGVYYGTHAYALSFAGAQKIVKIDTPLQYGYDATLMHACYNKLLNAFSLRAPLFVPDGGETTLIN